MFRLLIGMIVAATACWASHADAGDCCQHCGAHGSCRKVCHLVCEMKKVEKVTWCAECEDFCVPNASQRTHDCAACGDHVGNRHYHWTPMGAQLFTKKKLVKKVEIIEQPTYKYVTEDLCPHCQSGCQQRASSGRSPALAPAIVETGLPLPPSEKFTASEGTLRHPVVRPAAAMGNVR